MKLTKTLDYISDISGQYPVALLMAIPKLTPEMMEKKLKIFTKNADR